VTARDFEQPLCTGEVAAKFTVAPHDQFCHPELRLLPYIIRSEAAVESPVGRRTIGMIRNNETVRAIRRALISVSSRLPCDNPAEHASNTEDFFVNSPILIFRAAHYRFILWICALKSSERIQEARSGEREARSKKREARALFSVPSMPVQLISICRYDYAKNQSKMLKYRIQIEK
jgi:hypothetical protein